MEGYGANPTWLHEKTQVFDDVLIMYEFVQCDLYGNVQYLGGGGGGNKHSKVQY